MTATSANGWKLKSGSNEIGYKLADASTATEATTSWTFDSLSDTATTQPAGVIVEDYSDKPAGTYQDTVTFTASVVTVKTLTVNGVAINYSDGDTWRQIIAKNDTIIEREYREDYYIQDANQDVKFLVMNSNTMKNSDLDSVIDPTASYGWE